MVIPPDFFTEERIVSDKEVLRLYFDLCKELKLTEDPKVIDTFVKLNKITGKPSFLQELILLAQFINKITLKDDSSLTRTNLYKKITNLYN